MQLILLFICRHSGCGTILFFNECTNTCTHALLNWVCTNCVYVCMLHVCVYAVVGCLLSPSLFHFPFSLAGFSSAQFPASSQLLLSVCCHFWMHLPHVCLFSHFFRYIKYTPHSPDDKSICVPRWLSGKLYCINCAKAVTPLNLIDLYKCLCALDRFYIKTHL